MSTYGDMFGAVTRWLKEPATDDLLFDAINDACSDLWEAEIQVILSNFIGGPVTVQIGQGVERAPIVLIPDPVAPPTLNAVPGGALAARNYDYGFTWVTDSGSETNLSPLVSSVAIGNNQLAAAFTPTLAPPSYAVGWNIYMSLHANGRLALQNQDPLPLADVQNTLYEWIEPQTGIVQFGDPGNPPAPPTANTTADSIAYITHLEQQLPDTTWRPYDQSNIDSVMMRRLARTIASATPYQYYAYDFVNNSRIEIRPATGGAINPRYFFIQRPPKARIKTATIPFPSAGEEAFVRYRSLSLLLLADHEYSAAEHWESEAGKKLSGILLAANKQNSKRNTTIKPFLYS
jgi:hypothetical protein